MENKYVESKEFVIRSRNPYKTEIYINTCIVENTTPSFSEKLPVCGRNVILTLTWIRIHMSSAYVAYSLLTQAESFYLL